MGKLATLVDERVPRLQMVEHPIIDHILALLEDVYYWLGKKDGVEVYLQACLVRQ